jgi:hypothetical protein
MQPGISPRFRTLNSHSFELNLSPSLLKKAGFSGPLILHDISEYQVDAAVRLMKGIWEKSSEDNSRRE